MSSDDPTGAFRHIVWTYSLTRLAVLVGQAIEYKEPVLLIGDTGSVSRDNITAPFACHPLYFIACAFVPFLSIFYQFLISKATFYDDLRCI